MIFQVDKHTGQRLSGDMTLDQAKRLPVLDYIDLGVTEDADDGERGFVAKYRMKNEIDIEELAEIAAGNRDNTDLKQKINRIKSDAGLKSAGSKTIKKK